MSLDNTFLANSSLAVWFTALSGLVALVAFVRFKINKGVEKAEAIGDNAANTNKPAGKRTFSRKEVAKHDTADDLWIILQNTETKKLAVYDITAYVEEHPGGQAILNNAGNDSTKGFYGPQHPSRVFDIIEDFYIGELEQHQSSSGA